MSCSPAAPALSTPSSTSSPASVSSATSSPFMPALAFSPGSPFIDSQAAAGAPSPSSLTQTDGELSTCTTGMPHLFDLSPHGHPDEQQWSSSSSLQNDAGEQNTSYSHLGNEKPVEAENLDCSGRASSSSNIPSPILEQDDIAMCLDESAVMGFSPSKEVDVKEIVRPDQMYFSGMDVAPCCKEESSSDDVFMLRLEELLEAGIPQELVGGSGSSCVDDLFASGVPNTAQDVPVADGLSEWSLDSLKEFERLPFQEEEVAQAGPTDGGGEEESASQLFTSWLRNNAHWISLSDLRKIKLRTSTIENVTSRLGGGKKGLMLFLKFVLMWVQNSQMKRTDGISAMSPSSVAGMPEFVGISALGMDSHQSSTREQGVEALVGHSQCRTFPHMSAFPYSEDWITSRSRWMQALNGDQGFTALPNPNFHSLDTAWLQHSRLSRNVSTMPPSNSQSSRAGLNGRSVPGDIANMVMMMQQQHRHDANPAATTRAARKSRMERQRWSVRRNRKWAAGRHPNQHRYMSGSTDSSIHHNLNVQSWSQFVATTPGCSNSEVCASQERLVCRSSVLDVEQVAYPYPFDLPKKMEKSLRLLFHKELKQSDVGNLGRIVLPKKAAETCLPPLELRDGVNLDIEDLNSSKVWNMRYRFWPNNKSRMYLLENTSDFVKSYDLKEGDFMMLYYNNATNRYMIRGAKGSGQGAGAAANNGDLEGMGDEASIGDFSRGGMDMVGIARSESVSDDTLLAELTEQSLEDLKDIPDFTI